LWLFGGYGLDSTGTDGELNDLWMYTPSTGIWTWISGASLQGASGSYGAQAPSAGVPGARDRATSWIDASGNLWLFGGYGYDVTGAENYLNDLWEFTPSSGVWSWQSGASVAEASGSYGTLGRAASSNAPGARAASAAWADASGNLWLFGGFGFDSSGNLNDMNDVWQFNLAAGSWTWVNGSDLGGAGGSYGTLGAAATSTADPAPGARDGASAWIDSNGNAWLFGGEGYDSAGNYTSTGLNDLFEYNP
jgi:N-acetylneuraminic acid mutarotase